MNAKLTRHLSVPFTGSCCRLGGAREAHIHITAASLRSLAPKLFHDTPELVAQYDRWRCRRSSLCVVYHETHAWVVAGESSSSTRGDATRSCYQSLSCQLFTKLCLCLETPCCGARYTHTRTIDPQLPVAFTASSYSWLCCLAWSLFTFCYSFVFLLACSLIRAWPLMQRTVTLLVAPMTLPAWILTGQDPHFPVQALSRPRWIAQLACDRGSFIPHL